VVKPDTLIRWHRRGWRLFWRWTSKPGGRPRIPTADWTIQQFRMAIPGDAAHRFLIHDRDAIDAPGVDGALASMGLQVLKTPVRTPQANAWCEGLIGTLRRECLDWLIPFNERHLRRILSEWVPHYNRSRPHASLGPGLPEPPPEVQRPRPLGHRLPAGYRVAEKPILGGLHHEYRLEREAA
jgi:putative transposase